MGFIRHQKNSSGSIGVSGYTSNSTLTTTGSAMSTYTLQTTYHLLGEDIKVEGHADHNIAQTISLINCIGWKYYEEIQKQGISFSGELKEILEQRYKSHTRDQKINNILD
jgi:hypothetical protein